MLRMLHALRMPDMLHIHHILRKSPRHYTKRAAQRQIPARIGRFSPDLAVLKKGGSCSRKKSLFAIRNQAFLDGQLY